MTNLENSNFSFIVSPEIKVNINNKNLPVNFKGKADKCSQQPISKQVKFSDREKEILKKLSSEEVEKLSTNESTNVKAKKDKTTALTLPELKRLKTELAGSSFLCDVIEGANFKLPENEIVERNPELEKRVKRLMREQEQRVYNSMTKNVDSSRKFEPEETIAYQMKQINRHLIAVAQFIFSVIAGFMFGFLGIELIVGNLDFGFRLLLGIICALVIALAEIYFLAKHLNEEYVEQTSPAKTSEKLKTN